MPSIGLCACRREYIDHASTSNGVVPCKLSLCRVLTCRASARRDRVRTTNNCLGDLYAAAVVEHLSKAELESPDGEALNTAVSPR